MFGDTPGVANTRATLSVAYEEANERGIEHLVVASNEGNTILQLVSEFDTAHLTIVGVTHQVGFREPGLDEMPKEIRQQLGDKGVKLLTTTHLLAGIDRSLRHGFGGIYPPEIIANTLRMFGQGVKVCVEISMMALDAGLIPYGEDVIAIAGKSRGADTACIIRPGHSTAVFETRIMEILCRPRP
ncbi:MAG: pyruvate kinase alpha/beta domain-containing protein [Limnochordia bacterium]|nr:hypothetical protein [Limnochordia bacterium]MDD2629234.1 pyruvate kinase alpha/beta domain-containing protein [Limnochordia bacterium]